MGKRLPEPARSLLSDGEWLRSKYEDELMDGTRISALLGCDRNTVYRAMKRHNIPVRGKPRASRLARSGSDFDEARCCEMYVTGFSTNEIARALGASKASILASLRRNAVTVRSKSEASRLRRDSSRRRTPPPRELLGKLDKCAICGVTRHLEIHHVNGAADDNRSRNLMALCWEHHIFIEYLVTRALNNLRSPVGTR